MSASDADGAPALTPKPSPLGGGGTGGLRELLLSSSEAPLLAPSSSPAPPTASSSLAPTATAGTGSLASSQQYRHRHHLSLMESDGEIAR